MLSTQNTGKFEKLNYQLTFASLVVLAIGIFTSVSFSALGHILIFIPGVYFTIRLYKEREINLGKSYWALIALCVAIILSVLFNTDIIGRPHKNILKIKYFLLALMGVPAYFYTYKNYMTEKKKKVLINLFIWSTTIATISGLIGLYTGFNPLKMKAACHSTRACGLYGMYMTYGYGISMFQVLLTGMILKKDFFSKYININLLYAAWVVNLIGLIFSFARGGWIAFLAALPFFFYKKNKKLFVSVCLIAVVVFGAAFAGSQKVRDVFTKRGRSNMDRIAFYKTAIKAFEEKPVLGWGYRNFEANMIPIKIKHGIEFPERGGHAHNNILEHLASTGAIGVICVILFYLFWMLETYKFSFILFPVVINFLTSGLFQYTFGDGENLFLIMTLWALGHVFGHNNLKSLEESH